MLHSLALLSPALSSQSASRLTVETEIKKTSPVPAQSAAGKSGNDLSGRRRQHAILLSGPSPAVLAEREKHGFVSKISQDSDLNVDVLDSIIQ